MRVLFSALAIAVMATIPFLPQLAGPVQAFPAADAAEYLPDDVTVRRVLSPMTISNFEVTTPTGGWERGVSFVATGGTGGGPEVPVLISINAAELPTEAGAAGYAQVSLQSYRDAVRVFDLVGELGPAGDSLTQDADEAYFGVYLTPPGAAGRMITALLLSRFETVVTAIEVTMVWETPGAISTETQQGLGVVLGLLGAVVNQLAS